jgi:hypothetical protein
MRNTRNRATDQCPVVTTAIAALLLFHNCRCRGGGGDGDGPHRPTALAIVESGLGRCSATRACCPASIGVSVVVYAPNEVQPTAEVLGIVLVETVCAVDEEGSGLGQGSLVAQTSHSSQSASNQRLFMVLSCKIVIATAGLASS